MRTEWRDCQAWKDFGLPNSTTSNEASKMFDAVVTQYVGWYDDSAVGGIEGAIDKMLAADPDFAMGQVMKNGLDALGTGRTVALDSDFKEEIDKMVTLCTKSNTTSREKKHIEAVKLWSEGSVREACNVWEDVLVDYPQDVLALKFAHDSYFYLGDCLNIRDSIARALPHWKSSMPLYGYVLGMHSFGLEETNLYDAAEKTARKGLEINKHDAWSTHTLCHVMEMQGRQNEGIQMMTDTVDNWSICGMLACHNFWHWCVYHIEKGDYQLALDVFDAEVTRRAKLSSAPLDLVDAASLLYRLELEGVNVGNRWKDVFEACSPHFDDHVLAFNDVHYLMACLKTNNKEMTEKLMTSIREYLKNGKGTNCDIMRDVGLSLCESFVAFEEGDYERAVDLIYPVRYKIFTIGGSHAQRDVFNLFLLNAAIKSPSPKHHKIARNLLNERKMLKEHSPMTDRLIARALSIHDA